MKLKSFTRLVTLLLALWIAAPVVLAAEKPNILVIWGDDIGYWNVSHNNRGMMGYQTPNIDRIANEGLSFTDYLAEQSRTAGRSAFITGQFGKNHLGDRNEFFGNPCHLDIAEEPELPDYPIGKMRDAIAPRGVF